MIRKTSGGRTSPGHPGPVGGGDLGRQFRPGGSTPHHDRSGATLTGQGRRAPFHLGEGRPQLSRPLETVDGMGVLVRAGHAVVRSDAAETDRQRPERELAVGETDGTTRQVDRLHRGGTTCNVGSLEDLRERDRPALIILARPRQGADLVELGPEDVDRVLVDEDHRDGSLGPSVDLVGYREPGIASAQHHDGAILGAP